MAGTGQTVQTSIELALIDLMRSKPFAEITVKELVKHAHVARVSFYRNFASKEDVLGRFIADRLPQLIGSGKDELADSEVRTYLEGVLEGIRRNAAFFELLRKNDLTYLLNEYFLREGAEYIGRFQPGAVPYQDIYYAGGTMLVIMAWIDRGMPETTRELAAIIDTLYYRRNFDTA